MPKEKISWANAVTTVLWGYEANFRRQESREGERAVLNQAVAYFEDPACPEAHVLPRRWFHKWGPTATRKVRVLAAAHV